MWWHVRKRRGHSKVSPIKVKAAKCTSQGTVFKDAISREKEERAHSLSRSRVELTFTFDSSFWIYSSSIRSINTPTMETLSNASFAHRKTELVWGFPAGASIMDTVPEDMLEMIHPHWKKFPPVNPMWHYLLVSYLFFINISISN